MPGRTGGLAAARQFDLEYHLMLFRYNLSLLGFQRLSELQAHLRDCEEKYLADGSSQYLLRLLTKPGRQISDEALISLDKTVCDYARRLSANRGEPVFFKYFQYAAVLFAEMFLRECFANRARLLTSLNSFCRGIAGGTSWRAENHFTDQDLTKLAFSIATGGGKTLVMHVNYWQFMKYAPARFRYANKILITPSEPMTEQHVRELIRSGIPCQKLLSAHDLKTMFREDSIFVVDICKLKLAGEAAKKEGKTIDITYMGNGNLLFVDEGHKGQTAGKEERVWKQIRDELGTGGFTFEYSATFRQIIRNESSPNFSEYSRAIIFHYPYKNFHADKFGKDFRVYNVSDSNKDFDDALLAANLLSFVEQQHVYQANMPLLARHNIEPPLWAVVGSKVIEKKDTQENRVTTSDVIRFLDFLRKASADPNFLKGILQRILERQSGITNPDGRDLFAGSFQFLRTLTISSIMSKVTSLLFNGGTGTLRVCQIKQSPDEFGLRLGEAPYFGVIFIGYPDTFKNSLKGASFRVEEDSISQSLFSGVNSPQSTVNILIGAKKFIEGWDCWRVSSLSLIHVGQGEGPQIVQLFGRGVRLRGEGNTLKRAGTPPELNCLETLNVFGLRAKYMERFLKSVENEGISYESFPLAKCITPNWEDKLYTLRSYGEFEKETVTLDDVRVQPIDLMPRISVATGQTSAISVQNAVVHGVTVSLLDYIDLIDIDAIFALLQGRKSNGEFANLVLQRPAIRSMLAGATVRTVCKPASVSEIQALAIRVATAAVEDHYKKQQGKFYLGKMQLAKLNREDDNLAFEYEIRVNRSNPELITDIRNLLSDINKLYAQDVALRGEDFAIHFDRHLYVPLFYKRDTRSTGGFLWTSNPADDIVISPVSINEGELEFIRWLREFLGRSMIDKKEIFVLRNIARRGVGFFTGVHNFYPDFIIWVLTSSSVHMLFVDPKGLVFSDNRKLEIGKNIKEVERSIQPALGSLLGGKKLFLDAFIISDTPWESLRRNGFAGIEQQDLETEHVLFMEDDHEEQNFIFKMFEMAGLYLPRKYASKKEGLLPLYSLKAAAGLWKENQSVAVEHYIDPPRGIRASDNLFVCKVVGKSMEPGIPDGAYCIFERYQAGSRRGQVVLAEGTGISDPEFDVRYTVKRYYSEKEPISEDEWRHTKIELRPDNRDFPVIHVTPEDEESIRIIGVFRGILPLDK